MPSLRTELTGPATGALFSVNVQMQVLVVFRPLDVRGQCGEEQCAFRCLLLTGEGIVRDRRCLGKQAPNITPQKSQFTMKALARWLALGTCLVSPAAARGEQDRALGDPAHLSTWLPQLQVSRLLGPSPVA